MADVKGEGTFPPSGPTGVQRTIPSYLYVQYNDDDHLQAFVASFNGYAQAYLDYLNNLNLPVYTNGNISGGLLDWVALGLYGMLRPGLPSHGSPGIGPFNTWMLNTIVFNGIIPPVTPAYFSTSDDVFKRILTWHFLKGDGKVFNVRWLKRRVARFLRGMNGINFNVDQTYDVDVTFTAPRAATITLLTSPISTIFASAVAGGVLELPFQIAWTVTLV